LTAEIGKLKQLKTEVSTFLTQGIIHLGHRPIKTFLAELAAHRVELGKATVIQEDKSTDLKTDNGELRELVLAQTKQIADLTGLVQQLMQMEHGKSSSEPIKAAEATAFTFFAKAKTERKAGNIEDALVI